MNKLNERVESLDSEFKEIQHLQESLGVKHKSRNDKLEYLSIKQSAKKDEFEKQKDSIEAYVKRGKEFLGLTITKTTTDTTIIIFENIDKCEPDRKFLCEFTLDGPDSRRYKGMLF